MTVNLPCRAAVEKAGAAAFAATPDRGLGDVSLPVSL